MKADNQVVFLPYEGGYKKVALDDVQVIEAQAYQSILHVSKAKSHKVGQSLMDVLQTLGGGRFLRVHRSFAINIEHINILYAGFVVMDNGQEVPIGKAYRQEVRESLTFITPRKRWR
nr:LytTR family DNA-binding domain-containing protein [Bacteroides uniformis]